MAYGPTTAGSCGGQNRALRRVALDRRTEPSSIRPRCDPGLPKRPLLPAGYHSLTALTLLVHCLPLRPDHVVLSTAVEHHANMLPWRRLARVVYLEPPIALIRSRNGGRVKRVPERVWERLFDKLDVPTLAETHDVEYVVGEVE